MAEPIASRTDDPYRRWENDDDTQVCKDRPLTSETTVRQDDTSASEGTSFAAPDHGHGVQGPHADAYAQSDDLYAGAFVLKGRDQSGVEVEVFSASAHRDAREEVLQAGMARIGGSTDDQHFSARGEAFTAQFRVSVDNVDGSTGMGASIGATVVGGEVTGTLGPISLTGGTSVGLTYGAAVGLRDSDKDGKTEYCGRLDFGVGSAGVCVEKFW